MTSVGRVEQAILLIKDRLRKLGEQSAGAAASSGREAVDPLGPVRMLARQPSCNEEDLRKALVRGLLAESLGPALVTSLEFQNITDKVTQMLEESEAGRQLLADALREIG